MLVAFVGIVTVKVPMLAALVKPGGKLIGQLTELGIQHAE
jgi:hypothetical protein